MTQTQIKCGQWHRHRLYIDKHTDQIQTHTDTEILWRQTRYILYTDRHRHRHRHRHRRKLFTDTDKDTDANYLQIQTEILYRDTQILYPDTRHRFYTDPDKDTDTNKEYIQSNTKQYKKKEKSSFTSLYLSNAVV